MMALKPDDHADGHHNSNKDEMYGVTRELGKQCLPLQYHSIPGTGSFSPAHQFLNKHSEAYINC